MTTLVINGQRVTVDDSFLRLSPEEQNRTVEEIASSMGASAAPQIETPPAAEPAPGKWDAMGGPLAPPAAGGAYDPLTPPPPVERSFGQALYDNIVGDASDGVDSYGEQLGRGLNIAGQGAGRGVADLAGLPGDVSVAAMNTPIAISDTLADWIMGSESPEYLNRRYPPSPIGSDAIANTASAAAETVGVDVLDPAEMSPGEKMLYSTGRFAAQGLATGVGLARSAPAVAESVAATKAAGKPATWAQNVKLGVTSPYRGENTGRVLLGDAMAGAGTGAAVEAVDQNVSDEAWYKPGLSALAGLFGGVAGAGATKLAVEGAPGVVRGAYNRGTDYTLPLNADGTGRISRNVANQAARLVQDTATDLPKARQTLDENLASFGPGAPTPSPFTMTEDPGLRGLERGYRTSGDPALAGRMEAQEQGALDYATERVISILDEGADQPGALEAIRSRPGEIKAAREDAALPLLREAEASGVSVDAQPVADMLDAAMVGPKRPEVLRALKTARDALNVPGGDQLDTSVAGLYESRKAINDLIEGRSESNTGKFAQSELIGARKALDEAIIKAEPRFGEYLTEFRDKSRPLDVFEGPLAKQLMENETDLRNTASRILSPSRYGTEKELGDVMAMIGDNPEAQRGFKAAVADVLVDRVTKNKAGEELKPGQVVSVYNQHRDTLAKVFTPDDMKALDEAHNIVRLMDTPRAEARTLNLASTRAVDPLAVVQAALLGTGKDMITTTMIMSRLKFAAKFLGVESMTTPYKVNEVVKRMQFDPDLAKAILNRPVSEGTGRTWSQDVQALLAGAEFSRGMAAEEEENTVDTIMREQ